jgi:hypothetical protein
MLLITNFLELGTVAARGRKLASRQHAVSERSLSEMHVRGMAGERHGMCESNTAALCKSNGKDTAKALAERHGNKMGTAWYV